jgi:Bacterial transcriptional regulator
MRFLQYKDLDLRRVKPAFAKVRAAIEAGDFKSPDVKKLHVGGYYRAKLDHGNRLLLQFAHHDGAALKVGDRLPLGIGAAGVAMLAAMPDAQIATTLAANQNSIDRDYPRCTLPVIHALLAQTRERGYSVIPGLIVKGYLALGVALCNGQGRPESSISLVTSAARLPPSRQAALGGRLLRLASDLMGDAGSAPAQRL